MERLTKKHGGSYTQFGDKYIPNHNIRHKQCVEKLGKLEDIEEELGITLEVLFKALKDGAYFKTDYYGIDITYHFLEEHEIWLKRKLFDIRKENLLNNKSYYTGGFIFYWKDYSKTWALTKEELE